MELRLPDNPTEGDLVLIEKYLKEAKKKSAEVDASIQDLESQLAEIDKALGK